LAKNEEGEFELVLGNRQLISVFLVVVILLAVFFSMGYIVGRNSAPGSTAETARNNPPSVTESAPKASSPTPAPTPDVAPAPADEPPAATHSEQPAPTRSESAPVRAPKEVKAQKEPKPEPAAERVSTTAGAPGEPGPGQYWQVVATARPDAEIIAEALTKKGFHTLVTPAPKDGVFRVLVGPLKDPPTQAQTRTNLEAAGFKNPMLRKY